MERQEITQILVRYQKGDGAALEVLLPIVYQELRRLAASYLRRERSNHTLQPTALVHEAFLRLVDQKDVQWQNRAHFFAITAQLMRRILVDHARAKQAVKRGGTQTPVSFDEALHIAQPDGEVDILALNDALNTLATLDERQAKIVELKFFGGLEIEEIAEVLSISPATIKRDWNIAKAWLFRELNNAAESRS